MPSLFKKRGLSYRTPEGRKCQKRDAVTTDASGKEILRPGYRKKKEKSKNWYGRFADAQGQTHCVPSAGTRLPRSNCSPSLSPTRQWGSMTWLTRSPNIADAR